MSIEIKDDLPAMSPKAAADAMKTYQEICKAMLEPSDYSTINGKEHKNKSAWRKLARAFSISDEIIGEDQENVGDDSRNFIWRIKVKATAPNGRHSIGIGACASQERKFAHPDHDVYATAHTRAKNRAISDLIGAGEVSAEELEDPNTKAYADRINKEAQTTFGPRRQQPYEPERGSQK